jgi:hypothetical protein
LGSPTECKSADAFPLFRTSLLIRAQHFLDVFPARSICDARRRRGCLHNSIKIMTRRKINSQLRAAAENEFLQQKGEQGTRCASKKRNVQK